MKVLLVLLGGALGALVRYGVTTLSAKAHNTAFPMGTLYVNLAGCFLIGLVFGLGELKGVNPQFRLFFVTGFLGALTTFSTYSLETVCHGNSGLTNMALANIAVNNIGGIALVRVGLIVSKLI